MRTKTYTKREFAKLLGENGFELARCRGSHFVYKKDDMTITVPKNLNKMIGRRLIKEYKLI